jgi:hypothetical protein
MRIQLASPVQNDLASLSFRIKPDKMSQLGAHFGTKQPPRLAGAIAHSLNFVLS